MKSAMDDDPLAEAQGMDLQERTARPKVTKTWNNDNVMKLIRLAEASPCIWDKSDQDYSNKRVKANAWQNIYARFNGTYELGELCAKWTNLRIQYRHAQAKPRAQRTWKFFNAMGFLGTARQHVDNQVTDTATQRSVDTGSASIFSSSIEGSDVNDDESYDALTVSSPQQHYAATALATSTIVDQQQVDRNSAFSTFLLSELRSLPHSEADLLRCRLHRTLLEFNEERGQRASANNSQMEFKFNARNV